MNHFFLIRQYIFYWFKAKSGGHGIHSPFVFDFIKNVLEDDRRFYAFDEIETLRKHLYQDKKMLKIQDFGAGSLKQNLKQRVVSDIAKTAGRNEKFGKLLFRMMNHYQIKNAIELGTSLGIGTSYIAKANQEANIISIEGSPEIALQATESFSFLNLKNIKQVVGNFDEVLEMQLQNTEAPDLIFIDGNHRKQPTIDYFNTALKYINSNSIIIFDDIHWSKGMHEAWDSIRNNPRVFLSIDLFYFGIIFFNPNFKEKQHFILNY